MARKDPSLIAGRNRKPLTPDDIQRATNTFLGFDQAVLFRYEAGQPTAFLVAKEGAEATYGWIRFGDDLYPGDDVVAPNAVLSMAGAVAHELTHYYRWHEKLEIAEEWLEHVDEALTSLQAIQRYDRDLSDQIVRELVADAVQRLQLFVRERREQKGGAEL